MTDTTIQNVLIPTETGYDTVDIQIEAGLIAAVAPDLDPAGSVVDGRDKLLLPGLINAHTHSSEMWQRGIIPPYPLELWIAQLHEFSPLSPEQIYWSALGTALETLLSGGTTVVDHLVLIPGQELETIEAAERAYRQVGIRAFIGPLIQDEAQARGIPSGGTALELEPYFRSTQATLELVSEAIRRFHRPAEGIEIMVAPTGIQLCSDALLRGCIELSQAHQLCRHAHLLETQAQKQLAFEKYGISGVRHLYELGWLGSKTSLAHCVWLDQSDVELLAETGSTVVHNPLSNLRLGSGIAPVLQYRAAGVNVCFGCDGAASNDAQDLLEAIKIGSLLHTVTDLDYRRWISPREAVQMASHGGAKGLGIQSQVGSLTVGMAADLVLYDLKSLSLLPRTDPIGLLILGRPVQVVDYAWVRGKALIAHKQPTTIDLEALRQKLYASSQWDPLRQSQDVRAVEAHYRQVMGLAP